MRSLTWKGPLAVKRVANLATCGGLTVDGSTFNKGSYDLTVISSATAGTKTFGYFSFFAQLQDLPNYSEFTSLYDTYSIVGVQFKMIPYATASLTGAAAVAASQQGAVFIHSVIDYDDAATVPASESGANSLRQYATYRLTNPYRYGGKGFKRYFKPKVATSVYQASAFTGYKRQPFGFVDCNDADVQGYGLKGVIEVLSGGSAIPLFFKSEATFYLKFRDPR